MNKNIKKHLNLFFLVIVQATLCSHESSPKILVYQLWDALKMNNSDIIKELVVNYPEVYLVGFRYPANSNKTWIINHGEILNFRPYNLLIYAMRKNNNELIDFLLEQGADVNARTMAGETPLSYAQASQYPLQEHIKRIQIKQSKCRET